jgi:ATP-dependent Clp protease protease subunit
MGFFDFFIRRRIAPPRLAEAKEDVHGCLLKDRVIFLETVIDDEAARSVIAQLLFLQMSDPRAPVRLYLNSPGGSITSAFAILDTMDFVKFSVHTYCIGSAGGTAVLILAHGARGFRTVEESAEIIFSTTRICESSEDPAKAKRHAEFLKKMDARNRGNVC